MMWYMELCNNGKQVTTWGRDEGGEDTEPKWAIPGPSKREHGSVSIVACTAICVDYTEDTAFQPVYWRTGLCLATGLMVSSVSPGVPPYPSFQIGAGRSSKSG